MFLCFSRTQMTELVRTQISDTVSAPAAPVTSLFDQQRQHHVEFLKQMRARNDANRSCIMFHILGEGGSEIGFTSPNLEENLKMS